MHHDHQRGRGIWKAEAGTRAPYVHVNERYLAGNIHFLCILEKKTEARKGSIFGTSAKTQGLALRQKYTFFLKLSRFQGFFH